MTGACRALAAVLGLTLPVLSHTDVAGTGTEAGLPGGNLPGAPPLPHETREALARELERRGDVYVPRTRHRTPSGGPAYTNRLLLEASPYLRQHAHNPVDWRAWGPEAFADARRLGRPVLVSIGYSTCHWCHVMEDESFDDVETARLLNERFVAIKVDREVRPDVDAVYMAAARTLSGQGGWPLNVWLTPDGEPFFAGTYFPPGDARGRGGRPGFRQVLRSIDERWNAPGGRARFEGAAGRVSAAVRRDLESLEADQSRAPGPGPLHAARESLGDRFDPQWGGLRGGAKFPASLPVRFLLRYHRRTGDADALAMAVFSLERMAAGGIHDQIGGGFHRYATDPAWRVPHFEKMLYDQALLALAYVEAWQATGREDFADVARSTLDFVAREMAAPGGGFTSSSDADSPAPDGERVEGYYFTWTPDELEAALGSEAAPVVAAFYGVTAEGPLEGRSVLRVARAPAQFAAELGTTPEAVTRVVAAARPRLLAARAARPAPLRDEKVLTAWNGLMISAFARASFALDDAGYRERAARAARFVLDRMWRDGRLARVALGDEIAGPAFLDDHAFLVAGLLDLYEADADPSWLRAAVEIQEAQDRDHLDDASGVYLRAPRGTPGLLARERPARDGALPSANAVAAMNLLRLHELTLEPAYLERARALRSAHGDLLAREPASVAELLLALERELDTPREIVVVRPEPASDVGPMLEPLRSAHLPSRALVVTTAEGPDAGARRAEVPWAAGRTARDGRVTAYVCENQVCDLPTTDPAVLAEQIRAARPLADATR